MAEPTEPNLNQVFQDLDAYDFSHPHAPDDPTQELHCDLVMKGGITSGVVYPLAVLELAKSHRFHSIGGTSAGAIAAAITAAAEYGRDTGGFKKLIVTVQQLQQRGFIANIFQPTPELRPVLHLLFITLKIKRRVKGQIDFPARIEIAGDLLKLLWSLIIARKQKPAIVSGLLGALLGLLLGGGWIATALTTTSIGVKASGLIWGVLLILLFWLIGSLIGTIGTMLLTDIPRNGFGVCDGQPVEDHDTHRLIAADAAQSPALTAWLTRSIDDIAGITDGPLTFGDLLRNHGHPERQITLNTVTANLSQGQPYILPFTDRQFLFSEQEWRKLFPAYVVEHMTQHAYRSPHFVTPFTISDERGQQQTLHFLPASDDMPVIVGARMSLSFPVLLSAVPLWSISRETLASATPGQPIVLTSAHMRRNWFSDGGTCSNFPIHFFDRLFPSHPTFGINLGEATQPAGQDTGGYAVDFQMEQQPELDPNDSTSAEPNQRCPSFDSEHGIILPSAYPKDHPGLLWKPLDGNLLGFLGSIIDTGLFYRDNLQARLPSYYDRIVTILLNDKEGGINLDMSPASIEQIAFKGHLAGQKLAQCFDFDHHKWVRLRLMLSQLEQQMIELHTPLIGADVAVAPERLNQLLAEIGTLLTASGIDQNSVQRLLDVEIAAFPDRATRFPYARDQAWVTTVLPQLYALLLLVEVWGSEKYARFQLQQPVMPRDDVHDDNDHIRLRVTSDL